MKLKKAYVATDSALLNLNEQSEQIRTLGRTTRSDSGLSVHWQNSGFAFNFSGCGFVISLGSYSADMPAYVKVYVDDSEHKFAVVNGSEKLIVENLPEKRHSVTAIRVTEGRVPLSFESVRIFGSPCRFIAGSSHSRRRIEFLGDSLTCGFENLSSPDGTVFHTYLEDSTQTYAYFTASALRAEIRTLCLSGKGFVCNCNGERSDIRAPEFFFMDSFDGAKHDFSDWIPQVLVINSGTNDLWGGATADEYVTQARDFLLKVRQVYPKTVIIWLNGMMVNYFPNELRELMRSLGGEDKGFCYFSVDPITEYDGETGGIGHPNVRANVRVARLLIRKIRSLTGWIAAGGKSGFVGE